MNKTALKNFATSARRELLTKVQQRALKLGITEDSIQKANIESSDAIFIDGRQLSKEEKIQRDKLIDRINQIGFKRVMEEVAYTWFNRFTALRFMEVNDYLPTHVRVLSSTNSDSTEPDMIKEALSLDLDLDKEYVYELKLNNQTEELFKYLIIKHCNDLNRYMPFMFETINDYTEILFPDGLLSPDSFMRQMTNTDAIPEKNWEKIEVIGWLYQYYIAEEKDRVFKEKKKYKAEEIPFATQLFTPDWIVRYMVQNSLGRYWIESHPEHRDLKEKWEFYLDNPETDFEEKLAPYINKELKVEDIKCFDPAMGSGHILVYMFDVLYQIYMECGYIKHEIPKLIIENNLYGLDIDDRAYQLACFSIVMKALEYDKRFLNRIKKEGLDLHLAAIQETNNVTKEDITYLVGKDNGEEFNKVKTFFEQFQNAKTTGSLIKVTLDDTAYLEERLANISNTPVTNLFETEKREKLLSLLPKLIKQTKIMHQTYDVLVTNPPYMGTGNMNKELSDFLKKNYPDSKADLFAAFMEVDHYLKKNGFYACINQHSWMFLSSFEKLRKKIIKNKFIENMLHLGPRAFEEIGGEVVQSTTFVLRNTQIQNVKGTYIRLVDERSAIEKKKKAIEAIKNSLIDSYYLFNQLNFIKIPGAPIAYWASDKVVKLFNSTSSLGNFADLKVGLQTGNNDKYLRYWYEVEFDNIGFNIKNLQEAKLSNKKWFPHNKGGTFRKWYGNQEYVVNYGMDGRELKQDPKANCSSNQYYFKEGMTWTDLTSGGFSGRYTPQGFIFDNGGQTLFTDESNNSLLYNIIGYLNSSVAQHFLDLIVTGLHYRIGYVSVLPFLTNFDKKISEKVKKCIEISKNDWDSFETSWNFNQHPFVKFNVDYSKIEFAYNHWKEHADKQINLLKRNEEELNRSFIQIYGLQDELTPEIDENDITIRKADLERDIKSFISYAIGCSFGRYSLDEEGLIYAGGDFDPSRYKTFPADKDNILPILPGPYFEDDIVSRFVDFVRVTFGEETIEENLDFVADAIGRNKNETSRETLRRYFLNDFFKDHVKTYKKRPIYWLFTSGKEKAFNCLIYMHRYDKTTLSRIRTDYLHEYQIRLDAEKKDLLNIIEGDSTAKEISNAKKQLKSLEKKIDELKAYDELLHHMADMQIEIDLDDGVKVNYEKFKGLVAPLK